MTHREHTFTKKPLFLYWLRGDFDIAARKKIVVVFVASSFPPKVKTGTQMESNRQGGRLRKITERVQVPSYLHGRLSRLC